MIRPKMRYHRNPQKKGKLDFKFDSETKSETERDKKKSSERSQTFPSRLKKVIRIKDEPLPERVTKTKNLKEDVWGKNS